MDRCKLGDRASGALSRSIVSLLLVVFAMDAANARAYIYSLTGIATQVETDANTHVVAFDGETSLAIPTLEPGRIAIYFSAECNVAANDETTWLDVDIRINGVAVGQTASDNALCSSRGVQSLTSGWVSANTDAFAFVSANSTHTVDVVARLRGWSPGDAWSLGETALVVVLGEQ